MALAAPDPIPLAVEMRGVVKAFGRPWRPPWRQRASNASRDKVALRGIDLEVVTGKITGIIGPNGSGKSTLIRVLATLIVPDAGEARVFGYDVVAEPLQVRRHVNRVSVEAAFFKEMSPWENMVYAARLYGGGGGDTRARVESILERLGLPLSTLDRPMKQLSRGQQQKVAIARSLLTSPALLLMDEPTTGLDPRSKREVQALLTMLREEHAATVLLCTHDLAEAEAMCDHVVILENGEILVQGPPQELCRRYPGSGASTTLEDVYMRLSGKAFEDEDKEESSE